MTKVYTDSDLDRARDALAEMDNEEGADEETVKLSTLAMYRDVWGSRAAVWAADGLRLTYQPTAE